MEEVEASDAPVGNLGSNVGVSVPWAEVAGVVTVALVMGPPGVSTTVDEGSEVPSEVCAPGSFVTVLEVLVSVFRPGWEFSVDGV